MVSAWGGQGIAFDFRDRRSRRGRDPRCLRVGDRERARRSASPVVWSAGLSQGELRASTKGVRGAPAWGPPLLLATSLARVGRPGELLADAELPSILQRRDADLGDAHGQGRAPAGQRARSRSAAGVAPPGRGAHRYSSCARRSLHVTVHCRALGLARSTGARASRARLGRNALARRDRGRVSAGPIAPAGPRWGRAARVRLRGAFRALGRRGSPIRSIVPSGLRDALEQSLSRVTEPTCSPRPSSPCAGSHWVERPRPTLAVRFWWTMRARSTTPRSKRGGGGEVSAPSSFRLVVRLDELDRGPSRAVLPRSGTSHPARSLSCAAWPRSSLLRSPAPALPEAAKRWAKRGGYVPLGISRRWPRGSHRRALVVGRSRGATESRSRAAR